jgi:hypothetical protein
METEFFALFFFVSAEVILFRISLYFSDKLLEKKCIGLQKKQEKSFSRKFARLQVNNVTYQHGADTSAKK